MLLPQQDLPSAGRRRLFLSIRQTTTPPPNEPNGNGRVRNTVVYIVVISIIATIILIGGTMVLLRSLRTRHPNPTYIPTTYLKQKWTNWKIPAYRITQGDYERTLNPSHRTDTAYNPHRPPSHLLSSSDSTSNGIARPRTAANSTAAAATRAGGSGAGVDRNTSIRSIMTLPAYAPSPSPNETTLGLAGDRDGVDIILELPTQESQEALREAEMEQLFQIRQLRRQWNAAREERRERRRVARERGDVGALEVLREEARRARDTGELDELRRELEGIKGDRDAAVGVVQYAHLGVARHDGTRVRGGSMESERVGLLADAEGMGARASLLTLGSAESGHRRVSSIASVESEGLGLGITRSRGSSMGAASPRLDGLQTEGGMVVDVDLNEAPPVYEEQGGRSGAVTPSEPPPNYASPTTTDAPVFGAENGDAPGQRQSLEVGSEVADERRHSRGVGGVPQLPSLRLARLPQIVVDSEPARNQPS